MRASAHYTGALYERWYGEAADRPADVARLRTPAAPDARRAAWTIGTADEVAAGIRGWQQTGPYTHLLLPATPAGLPPAQTTPWLERFAREVLPRFKDRNGAGQAP